MVCIFLQESVTEGCIIARKSVYWVSVNEDGDTGLTGESETHKHDKLFSEDPNTSNVLNVMLRHSTLLGCDLFSAKMVQVNTVIQGTMRNVSSMGGRASSEHKAEINEGVVYEHLSFGNVFIHLADGHVL